jgi:hypothetical protein
MPAAMPRRRPTPVSEALGMAILQFAGRNAADQGHDVASDVGIEVLVEHPDNLATPSHARDQIHARAPPAAVQPMGREMSRKAGPCTHGAAEQSRPAPASRSTSGTPIHGRPP